MQLTGARYLFFGTLFFCSVWCTNAQPPKSGSIVTLTNGDAGKTLVIKKSQVFMLTLPDHIDGGYRFDSIQYKSAIIHLQRHSETPPPPNSAPGRSGAGSWQFVAAGKGKTAIKLTATRPWKGGGTVTVFKNEIIVR